jgi:hypothetical protein
MQQVVFDKPYQFIPPLDTSLWPSLLQLYLPRYLRKRWGVARVECRNAERLRASLDAGHGILLAPNHSRLCDPLVLGILARQVGTHLFAMASWHLFMQGRFTTFMIRRMGAFSIYREGLDKAAISTAIDILQHARRPLIVFPEGVMTRHNDRLLPLMDGTAMIARTAARRRAQKTPPGRVVIHPIAIRYFFRGDLRATLSPVLADMESRLSWQIQAGRPLVDRIARIAQALLTLKEIEYFGTSQQGDLYQRTAALINHLLEPLEVEWSIKDKDENVVGRVKNLRAAILPDMVSGQISDAERERRWRQLDACYVAQQLSMYPRDYILRENNTPERVLETVERMEEDLTDKARVHGPLDAVVCVGQAIVVPPQRERGTEPDPVMDAIEKQLQTMLAELVAESAEPWQARCDREERHGMMRQNEGRQDYERAGL